MVNEQILGKRVPLLRDFIGHTAGLLDEWGNSQGRQQALRAAARLLRVAEAPREDAPSPLTPDAYAKAVVRLGQQLGGAMQYRVAPDHIRFTCTICRDEGGQTEPLCHLWWESLRRIAAERFGYGKVVVTPRDAAADAGCDVRLYLQPTAEAEAGTAVPVDRPAQGCPAPEPGGQPERFSEATVRQLQAKVRYLEQRTRELETALEERKLVEKAKGILMERLRLSEADAMRKLQQESQARNLKLAAVAQIIVQAGEIL